MEALMRNCIAFALANGASGVRITYNESLTDLVGMRDGEVDKVTHSLDRSFAFAIFIDGRFGTFSTNRLEEEALHAFILNAIGMARMLVQDPCRSLPAPERKVRDAVTGLEAGLYDPTQQEMDAAKRLELARSASLWHRKAELEKGFTILSEEEEYSDNRYDTLIIDSEGLCCRHLETSFEIGCEITLADSEGNRFSGYWWNVSPTLAALEPEIPACAETALRRAVAQIGPQRTAGGKRNLVISTECASRLLNPVLSALNGYSLQQQNSFLLDTLGKQVFPERLTVLDRPRSAGETGAKWFDSEGVAALDAPIIEKGVVKRYFVNTFIAAKTGLEPTVEDCTRIIIESTGDGAAKEDLMRLAGDGILVTGFNGGNSNSATGDFSYGIEGFAFADGKIVHPVREMLMTGNFITLWNSLAAVADDARPCLTRRIPSLWFREVDVR